jgi:hypothetical protein
MEPARRGGAGRATTAALLLLVGLAALGLWRVLSGSEALPYSDGSAPPASVQVTQDNTYSLAVPGGVRAMLAHGVPTAASQSGSRLISLQCTLTGAGTGTQSLTVSAESTSTKAENTVGHFVAPVTGRVHVDCAGWGAMFVPDSDNRPTDWSGWALLVAVIALTIGGWLALSEIRLARERTRNAQLRADDEDRFDDTNADEEDADVR